VDELPAKRGRPLGTSRVTEAKSVLSAYVPTAYHDRLAQLARQQDESVSCVVRRVLAQALDKK
jgi:hypothetical protein